MEITPNTADTFELPSLPDPLKIFLFSQLDIEARRRACRKDLRVGKQLCGSQSWTHWYSLLMHHYDNDPEAMAAEFAAFGTYPDPENHYFNYEIMEEIQENKKYFNEAWYQKALATIAKEGPSGDVKLKSHKLLIVPIALRWYKNITKLSLASNELKKFPYWIGTLSNLTSLDLSSNKSSTLPISLTKLTNLAEISVANNRLRPIEYIYIRFEGLSALDVSGTGLDALPESLYRAKDTLTYLKAAFNDISSIPQWIGEMSKLTFLDLVSNEITELPDSIGALSNLSTLRLIDNKIQRLPISIGNLNKLTSLVVDTNKLVSLPNSIGNLSQLTTLNLYNNQITALPETIGKARNLSALYVGGNKLTFLPESIGDLSKLRKLSLQDNNLETVPLSFGKLRLTDLDLRNNDNFKTPVALDFGNHQPKKVLISNSQIDYGTDEKTEPTQDQYFKGVTFGQEVIAEM
jgi:Leucine-rich repeat (LRR) protein